MNTSDILFWTWITFYGYTLVFGDWLQFIILGMITILNIVVWVNDVDDKLTEFLWGYVDE